MWFKKKSQEPETFQSLHGPFVKKNSMWEGYVEMGDTEVYVLISDVNGAPNPQLLDAIFYINNHLSGLERVARRHVPKLTDQHHFASIHDSNKEADFTLGFDFSQESWSETVYVDFKDERLIGSWSAG